MARTSVDIPFQCGRGAAKSKVERYLAEKGFKQKTIQKGEIVWRLPISDSGYIKCFEMEYGDGIITLTGFIAGIDRKKRYVEEALGGLDRVVSKQQMSKNIREIQKLFKD